MTTEIVTALDSVTGAIVGLAIDRAAAILRAGGLVAFPTETVYGLGANALDAAAVARIFSAKGRPAHNPVIVHLPDAATARALAAEWPETAARLAAAFWPGPLTLVLPRRPIVPDIVTAGGETVALRVPSHPVALALLHAAGVPIAAPSANRSSLVSPTTALHVRASLDGRIGMILDGGPTTGGIESTVISLVGPCALLLRPGLVSPAQLEAVIGPIDRLAPPAHQPPEAGGPASDGDQMATRGGRRIGPADPGEGVAIALQPLASPGLMKRHYAPMAPMELSAHGAGRVGRLLAEGHAVGWLKGPERGAVRIDHTRLTVMEMPGEPAGYAAALYAVLHTLDALGVTRIVTDEPPATDEWLAVRDRLRRASTPIQA